MSADSGLCGKCGYPLDEGARAGDNICGECYSELVLPPSATQAFMDEMGYGGRAEEKARKPDWLVALDLHKERIRRLQEALCECQQRDFFQADLHDELCPVWVVTRPDAREFRERLLRQLPMDARLYGWTPCPRCEGQTHDVGACGLCLNLGWLDENGDALTGDRRVEGSTDTQKAARPEHPGPPDVPGQEQCSVCGGFLGDDAYGHSRMCRCERGSTDTRLTEALRAFIDLMPYLKPSVPDAVPPPNTINCAEVERRIEATADLASAALASLPKEPA